MTELIKQKKQVPERLYSNKKLAALLIPLALDQLLNSFMGTIDTLVVSNLGSAAISAVSLVDSINILIVQAFFALASGGTVVCSHYLGCKSKDHAKEAARQLVFVTLMLSLIIGAICLVFNQQILNLIFGKVEKDVMAGAKQYFFYSVLSILAIGVPSGIENSMFQFGKLAIQSTVSLMGTAAIAAQGMTNVIENLNGILAIGIGIGLMTVVGETLGAGRKEEAVYYIKKLCIIAEITLAVSCLIFYLLVRPITYFGGMEPESAKLCIYMVTWISIVKPLIWIMAFIPAYGLRAAGDVKFSMTVSVLCMWFCRVSLVIFLARAYHMGPMAVWIGMFVYWGVRNIIFTIRFRSRKWLNHEVI